MSIIKEYSTSPAKISVPQARECDCTSREHDGCQPARGDVFKAMGYLKQCNGVYPADAREYIETLIRAAEAAAVSVKDKT